MREPFVVRREMKISMALGLGKLEEARYLHKAGLAEESHAALHEYYEMMGDTLLLATEYQLALEAEGGDPFTFQVSPAPPCQVCVSRGEADG